MECDLPRRLYGEGLEPQTKKINNSCRMKLLEILREKMESSYNEVKKDPLFSHLMAIEENDLKFSARLVHGFLCKELMTSKKHEKWFTFARRPLRFGLQEYHVVTGLKVKQEKSSGSVKWTDDDGFWSHQIKTRGKVSVMSIKKQYLEEINTWTHVDRVRLVYLCVIMGLVMGRDEKVNIPHLYMKLAMDLDKLRNYHWGLVSFDFLLKSMAKARLRLEQKNGYMMEGFLFAFQIWIMEAVPTFGEICGTKVNANFAGPMCGNWRGCAKCSYEDIIRVESLFPKEGVLYSIFDVGGDGQVLLASDFVRKDEMKDERVDRIVDMIEENYDWSNHVWEVVDVLPSEIEEADEEEVEAGDEEAHTEIGSSSHVTNDGDEACIISGRNKRKNPDRGADARKKKLLCELAGSSKGIGSTETNMKQFLETLLQASFTAFEGRFYQQFSDRMDKIETEVTSKLGRLDKLESEVTQIKTALVLTEMAGKTNEETVATKTGADTVPAKTGVDIVPAKSKKVAAPAAKKGAKKKDLTPIKLSLSSELDIHMSTQDYLESCIEDLSQDIYVKGFDPSQKMEIPQLNDRKIDIAGGNEPDAQLIYVSPENFEKIQEWQDLRTHIQVGPCCLDDEICTRIISPSKWLQNIEIDAVMYLFRERTTLGRWKTERVAFMTCVFSDLIRSEYINFKKVGARKYKMDTLLLEYGKGELPSHGRTRKLWSVDVDRMYIPVWVNRNHWIALCISFVTRDIEVFDCEGLKNYHEVEAFAVLVPRIVKVVQSVTVQKHLSISPYTVRYTPMRGLNIKGCHCGVYAIKHIECHALGLRLSLMDDDNIKSARIRILWDLYEAATDQELIERMTNYEPPTYKNTKVVEIDN